MIESKMLHFYVTDILSLLLKFNWFKSKSEARRAVRAGSIYVGKDKITNFNWGLIIYDGEIIRFGKQKIMQLELSKDYNYWIHQYD